MQRMQLYYNTRTITPLMSNDLPAEEMCMHQVCKHVDVTVLCPIVNHLSSTLTRHGKLITRVGSARRQSNERKTLSHDSPCSVMRPERRAQVDAHSTAVHPVTER